MASNERVAAWWSVLIVAMLGCAGAATAGTVTLCDGRMITGVVRFEGTDVLVVAADPGTDTRLPLAQVACVSTRDNQTADARPASAPDDLVAGRTAVAAPYARKPTRPPVGGIRAEYFADRAMTDRRLARREENLLYAWPPGMGPDPEVPGRFAARWTGRFKMPAYEEAKVRTLFLEFDGGVRFWLDGELKLDAWGGPPQGTHARYELEAGRSYDFKLEYWHDGGMGQAQLQMTTIDRQARRALKGWYFSPPPGDAAPPEVDIVAPGEGGVATASEPLSIEAAVHLAAGSVDRVRFYDNGVLAGNADRPPYRLVIERPASGPHRLTARAIDANGYTATSAPVTCYAANELPAGPDGGRFDPAHAWGVVGVVPPAEPRPPINKGGVVDAEALLPRAVAPTTLPIDSRVDQGGRAVTLTYAGGGLQGEADAFGCAYTDVDGDFQLTARVASLQCAAADAMPLAGIAIQADFRPDASRLSVVVGASSGEPVVLQLNRDRRKLPEVEQVAAKRPAWLRLTRAGRLVRTEASEDGRTWSPVGKVQTALPGRLRVALVACTRDPQVPVTAAFDHVTLVPWRATFAHATAGILLADGSFLDQTLAPMAGAALSNAELRLRPPGGQPWALTRSNVARVLFAPLTTEAAAALPVDATGVLLAGGDFLEGSPSLDGGRVTIESVLFGRRAFRAKAEVTAIVLNGAPARLADAPWVVSTMAGTRLLANSIRAQGHDLVVDEPAIGTVQIPQSAVVEVRSQPSRSVAGPSH